LVGPAPGPACRGYVQQAGSDSTPTGQLRSATHTVPIADPDGLTQDKYVCKEIGANADERAKQIKAAEGS
jgi:hypothetical protein